MKITQTAPRIKLRIDIADEFERTTQYKLLDNIGHELQDVRNNCIRLCVTYYELNKKEISFQIPSEKFKDGDETMTYRKFLNRFRPELKYAKGTLANYVEQEIISKFKNELKEYHSGKKSIPTFEDRKIPIIANYTELDFVENEYVYRPAILTGMGFQFKFVGVDKDKSLKTILSRMMLGEYKICDHFIKRDEKFWYLHLVYSFECADKKRDENIIVGVDVGYKVPAVCAVNNSEDRVFVGNGDTIHKFKQQLKMRKQRLQSDGGKTGHGRIRMMKAINNLKNFEANFIKTYNHKISKSVVEFAVKNNAGIIIMEDLNRGLKKGNKILTRNWSYYQLQQMIEYKAKANGIKVIKIPPQYTSQTCSLCGYTAHENRPTQSEFICHSCGYTANADYNAAKNIAQGGLNCSLVSNEVVITA